MKEGKGVPKRGESSGIRFLEEARIHSLELQRNVKNKEVKKLHVRENRGGKKNSDT